MGHHASTPEHIGAIDKVISNLHAALMPRDVNQLSSLLLQANSLFTSLADNGFINKLRASANVYFPDIGPAGYAVFVRFIRCQLLYPEEKFSNVEIIQNRHLEWAVVDYKFLLDGKLSSYGVEAWPMAMGNCNWTISPLARFHARGRGRRGADRRDN